MRSVSTSRSLNQIRLGLSSLKAPRNGCNRPGAWSDRKGSNVHKRRRNRHVHSLAAPDRELTSPPEPTISRATALRSIGEVVYALRVGDVIKIGHTTNLQIRFNHLRADEVLAFMPGTLEDEQQIHARLVDHRHHGLEWYYPTPGVLQVVNEIREQIGQEPIVA